MVTDGVDVVVVSKLTSQIIEQVTCIECCKYYIAPETAACGHTLCHSCWTGRRSCPYCSDNLNRQGLKLNQQLRTLTEHVHALGDACEKLFNIKLEEFIMDLPLANMQVDDPTEHVKEWLASSQNHFSAPVLSSEPSIQEQNNMKELSNSKIQIHTHSNKLETPKTVVVAPQHQEDWDKIEVLSDIEPINAKTKGNVAGPMDIEPYFFDENEYTTDKPRRSGRKREMTHEGECPKPRDMSTDKVSSKNSSAEEKRSLKSKQNWNSVKKMNKEFSKFKRNKSKLNVSIEMCKKSKTNAKLKNVVPTKETVATEENVIEIDENTPVDNKQETPAKNKSFSDLVIDKEHIFNGKKSNDNNVHLADSNKMKGGLSASFLQGANKSNDKTKSIRHEISKSHFENNLSTDKSSNRLTMENEAIESNATRMPFLKKSALRQKIPVHQESTDENSIKVSQKEIEPTNQRINTDDIEISIKIGNTITNILIQKKMTDVQLKVSTDQEVQTSNDPKVRISTDQEVQTSLGLSNFPNKSNIACSPIREINTENDEQNIQNKISVGTSSDTAKKNTVSAVTKTKKNTASADTTTAQFEITESVEKELSNPMNFVVAVLDKTQSPKSDTPVKEKSKTSSHIDKNPKESYEDKFNKNPNEIRDEDFMDMDIFNSGSVKESVQLLKNTKHLPSEILVPTLKNKQYQRNPDKRDRDDDEEMPSNKKQKVDLSTQKIKTVNQKFDTITQKSNPNNQKFDTNSHRVDIMSQRIDLTSQVSSVTKNIDSKIQTDDTTQKEQDLANDSEQMNYDAVMKRAFANIDADIRNSNKNSAEQTQTIKQTEFNNPTQFSQIIPKTQATRKGNSSTRDADQVETVAINEKYSENLFSMLEKDSEPQEAENKQPQPTTQQHIDNILTPAMCRELTSAVTNCDTQHDVEMAEPELGTPVNDDDDDKSVVEETPQKNSFTKPKPISDSRKTDKPAHDSQQTIDSQTLKTIIDISDTSDDKTKDITYIDNKKLPSLETPITISKFVHNIKHNSTPVARKSLNFEHEPEETLCPTTTQEKEFLAKAFESTPKREVEKVQYCVAGSCLTPNETAKLKYLCRKQGWVYADKFTNELTHLVVGVDENNISQRSVKYMCALSASKWIIGFAWVEQCLLRNMVVNEAPYEALDACGEPGPRRARLSTKKLFEGITFYCMPPFSVLDLDTLRLMLESAGGKVVSTVEAASVRAGGGVTLLLAEPEHTQEDRFMYLAMEHSIVPVNYEWALDCLGNHFVSSVSNLLLCPRALLPSHTAHWPSALLERDGDD